MAVPPELEESMQTISGVLDTFGDLEPARDIELDAHRHIVIHAGDAIILLIRNPDTGRTVRGVFTLADVPSDPTITT